MQAGKPVITATQMLESHTITYYHTCKRLTAERVLLLHAGRQASDHSYTDAGVTYYHILLHLQKAYSRKGVTVECRQESQ